MAGQNQMTIHHWISLIKPRNLNCSCRTNGTHSDFTDELTDEPSTSRASDALTHLKVRRRNLTGKIASFDEISYGGWGREKRKEERKVYKNHHLPEYGYWHCMILSIGSRTMISTLVALGNLFFFFFASFQYTFLRYLRLWLLFIRQYLYAFSL